MKKVLFLILASLLVLGACGNNNAEKKDDDKKSEGKSDKKSNDFKKDKNKKLQSDNQSNENNQQSTEQNNTQQQNIQSNQQQTQQANSSNQEPTKEEVAEWDRQNVKGGTDYGLVDEDEVNNGGDTQPAGISSNKPRSLREIKEETGKSPLDFTEEEKAEAQSYADAH